jgi:hypothetical protein
LVVNNLGAFLKMANWGKYPSSRILKAQVLSWPGGGTVTTTKRSPRVRRSKQQATLRVAAKWTFGIAETYDDHLIDKDEQYLKGKLAEP